MKTKSRITTGGYTKKRIKELEASLKEERGDLPPLQHVTPKIRVPLPPGIKEVLQAKLYLCRELKNITNIYTVSIDVMDNEWVLVVRGWDPPYDNYMGYPVKYVKSQFVRNPNFQTQL